MCILQEVVMAMLSMVTADIKPGRMEEFLTAAKELKAAEEQTATNLRTMRLFIAQVAGAETGRIALKFEYDDLASWGATVDAELAADPAFRAVAGADDPFERTAQTLFIEIPL
jgi:hypothetical protein